jgi:O-antigen/teichoic acid export membrane protein
VLSLGTIIALPRLLTVADYGLLGSALAIAAVFGVVSDTGMQLATSRHLATAVERGEDGGPIVGSALLLRGALGLGGFLFGSAVLVLGPFPTTVRLGGILGLAGLVNPAWSVYGSVLQVHFAIARFRTLALISGTTSAALSISVAALHGGVIGILAVQAVVPLLLTPLVHQAAVQRVRPAFHGAGRWVRTLLSTAWQVGASTLFATLYYRLDTVLLTVWSTSVEVAHYFAAYRLTEAFAIFPFAIVPAFFPAVTRLHVSSPSAASVMAWRLSRTLFSVGLLVAVAGILNADLAVRLLYGRQYAPAVTTVRILFLAVPMMYFGLAALQTTVAFGRPRVLLASALIGFVVNVVFNLILIPRFASSGAAVATVLTEAAVSVVALRWILSQQGKHSTLLGAARVAGAAVLTVATFPVATSLGTWPCIGLTMPWCAAALLASGAIDYALVRQLWRERSVGRRHRHHHS